MAVNDLSLEFCPKFIPFENLAKEVKINGNLGKIYVSTKDGIQYMYMCNINNMDNPTWTIVPPEFYDHVIDNTSYTSQTAVQKYDNIFDTLCIFNGTVGNTVNGQYTIDPGDTFKTDGIFSIECNDITISNGTYLVVSSKNNILSLYIDRKYVETAKDEILSCIKYLKN